MIKVSVYCVRSLKSRWSLGLSSKDLVWTFRQCSTRSFVFYSKIDFYLKKSQKNKNTLHVGKKNKCIETKMDLLGFKCKRHAWREPETSRPVLDTSQRSEKHEGRLDRTKDADILN